MSKSAMIGMSHSIRLGRIVLLFDEIIVVRLLLHIVAQVRY